LNSDSDSDSDSGSGSDSDSDSKLDEDENEDEGKDYDKHKTKKRSLGEIAPSYGNLTRCYGEQVDGREHAGIPKSDDDNLMVRGIITR
jgi:hypothetical protein